MICHNTRCSACGKCTLTPLDCALFKSASEVKKRRDKPVKSLKTEDAEQEAIIEYCELKHIVVVHIPNESKRSLAYGAKMKRMGLRKGFPDLLFPTPCKGYHGLYIELKRNKDSKPTKEQLQWLYYLNEQKYKAELCYGADEAIKVIEEYFGE